MRNHFQALRTGNRGISDLSRRAFLRQGSLLLAGASSAGPALSFVSADEPAAREPAARLGLLTDVHYADKPPRGSRHYRESIDKLREGVSRFNELQAPLALELGDFIDSARDAEIELGHLKAVEAEYARFNGQRHYVLGNHCVEGLTKQQFLDHSAAEEPYYSFDEGDFHFVVLDACYRSDGVDYGANDFHWTDANVPPHELKWLRADLAGTKRPTLVFVHQRLDVSNNYGVKNAPQVRKVLEESGRVLAVFQGHNHKNEHKVLEGIHYCTLAAVVEGSGAESNAYAILDVFADGSLRIDGFRQQKNYDLPTVAS